MWCSAGSNGSSSADGVENGAEAEAACQRQPSVGDVMREGEKNAPSTLSKYVVPPSRRRGTPRTASSRSGSPTIPTNSRSLLDGERRAHHGGALSGLALEVAQGVRALPSRRRITRGAGALFGDRVDAAVLLDALADLAVLEADLLDLRWELPARHRERAPS